MPQDMVAVACSPPVRFVVVGAPSYFLDQAGLVWVNEWAVADQLAVGRLREVLAAWSPVQPGLCLYYPRHRNNPAGGRAFVARVWEVYGRVPTVPTTLTG
nr:hypothetical protein [Rhodoferax sp.]